jgi:hypothetical protein
MVSEQTHGNPDARRGSLVQRFSSLPKYRDVQSTSMLASEVSVGRNGQGSARVRPCGTTITTYRHVMITSPSGTRLPDRRIEVSEWIPTALCSGKAFLA